MGWVRDGLGARGLGVRWGWVRAGLGARWAGCALGWVRDGDIQQMQLAVFTTLRVEQGKALWLDDHLERLLLHARAFALPYPGEVCLRREIMAAVDGQKTHLLRITLGPDHHSIVARAGNPPSGKDYEGAPILVTDICVDSKLGQFKTNQDVPYKRARELAAQHSVFEALLVDEEGYVVDGSRSSPLIFCNDTLTALEGGLRGITREKVLAAAQQLGVRVARTKIKAHELDGLLLVAGSGIGLVPCGRIGDERIKKLVEAFRVKAYCAAS